MSIITKEGDIALDYINDQEALILQQNNCTAVKLHFNTLAGNLAKTLPYSNPYSDRKPTARYKNLAIIKDRPEPGSIGLRRKPGQPIVCCLFAQYRMGGPNSQYYSKCNNIDEIYKNTPDGRYDRLTYFKLCLNKIINLFKNRDLEIKNIRKIIIPKYIGCGAAKGNSKDYNAEIIKFANQIVKINDSIRIYIIDYKK